MVRYSFRGLDPNEVERSRAAHGTNVLPENEPETFWEKLRDNFNDPLIKILLVALVITLVLAVMGYSDWLESLGIASAVFIATFVSTWSEHKNEANFQALQREASRTFSNVFRSGSLKRILSSEIVVGDYVLLQPGEIVSADGELIAGQILLNEASLTGESDPIIFRSKPSNDPDLDSQPISHRQSHKSEFKSMGSMDDLREDSHEIVRQSCVVNDGEGVLLVTKVGENTDYGRVNVDLAERSGEERESPLQVKLSNLAEGISKLGYLGASAIAVSFLFKQFVIDNQWSWEKMMAHMSDGGNVIQEIVKAIILGIIVIVVAVPEGLPMMIAIVLSLNMNRLLKDKVHVRKLLGIETAGSISMLFADKTGTMTQGRFEPVAFLSGSFTDHNAFANMPGPLASVLEVSLLVATECSFNESTGQFIGGNPSDQAALAFLPATTLGSGGLSKFAKPNSSSSPAPSTSNKSSPNHNASSLNDASQVPQETTQAALEIARLEPIKTIMFNSSRKYSATSMIVPDYLAHRVPALSISREGHVTFVKGAPEILLPRCTHFYDESGKIFRMNDVDHLHEMINDLSARGTRVILVATSNELLKSGDFSSEQPPEELILVGVIGIRDEIRPTTKRALETAREAGIRTIMITGDKKETAVAVAYESGLLEEYDRKEATETRGVVMTSDEIRKLNDSELSRCLNTLRVLARALPHDKARLVTVAQNRGEIVGMTGDGSNDAVALKLADVGFSMGSGVDVAKEASDIVVLDDNFASTMQAVLYGRTIFKSIRKFIVFQSTINLASTVIVFMGPILGFDFPLTLIQLLWVNLVMDTLAALAFGGETPLPRYMQEKPIQRSAPIISLYMWTSIIFNGLYMALLSIVFLTWDRIVEKFTREGLDVDSPTVHTIFLTGFFCFFIFIANFNAFNARTSSPNLLDSITSNKNFVAVVSLIFFLQWIFTFFGGSVLRTVPLRRSEWTLITLMAATIIPFDVVRKLVVFPFLNRKKAGRLEDLV